MFIQKIFHVHHNLEDTKARLAHTHGYRRCMEGVKKAVVTADGVAQFDLAIPKGFHVHFVLVELPTPDSNQVLFQSSAGNMDISGLIEFIQIRGNLTEVQLTLEYRFQSLWHSVVDAFTGVSERFLDRQLRCLQSWLDGTLEHPVPTRAETPTYTAHLPQLAH